MTLEENAPSERPPDTEMDELDELGLFAEKLRLEDVMCWTSLEFRDTFHVLES